MQLERIRPPGLNCEETGAPLRETSPSSRTCCRLRRKLSLPKLGHLRWTSGQVAYHLLFALIKEVEAVLLKAEHEVAPLIRNGNRDQPQIDTNLDSATITVCWSNFIRRGVLNNTRCALDDGLIVMTKTDPKGCHEAPCSSSVKRNGLHLAHLTDRSGVRARS